MAFRLLGITVVIFLQGKSVYRFLIVIVGFVLASMLLVTDLKQTF